MADELTLERRDTGDPATWDATVCRARQTHFMFESGYLAYHADRFTDASLLVLAKGTPVAALPASRHGEEIISHGGLTFGGLLSGPELTAARVLEAYAAAVALWRGDGARRLVVKPVPHIYHQVPAEEELFALHGLGATLIARHLSQAVRAGSGMVWSSERRRAVKRSERSELTLARSDEVERFIGLQREVLQRRHGVDPVHTETEMRLLADRFPEQIKLYAATAADGELLSGVLVYETATVAHAQYIAASERGHELRAQDALFAHLLTEVYADKPWFDFGISNERDGTLNAGLARNKEGFGARSVVYDRYAVGL